MEIWRSTSEDGENSSCALAPVSLLLSLLDPVPSMNRGCWLRRQGNPSGGMYGRTFVEETRGLV